MIPALTCLGWIWLGYQTPETKVPDVRALVITLEVVPSPGRPADVVIRIDGRPRRAAGLRRSAILA